MKYLISRQGQASGPFSIDEIAAKVVSKELELFDYIFDEAKDDWVLLMEFPQLAAKMKSSKPPRPGAPAANFQTAPPAQVHVAPDSISNPSSEEWFVLKGENRFGPFSYVDVLRMLQQKIVFPFDLTWSASLDGWRRFAELDGFQPEKIRDFYANSKQKDEIFVQRKFPRKAFGGRVVIHDNLTIWRGEGYEISKGGVGIHMNNSLIVPGQHVFVHFRKDNEWPAFNAVCEVVSKKFVNDSSPVQYGLRFLSLSQEVQDEFFRKVA